MCDSDYRARQRCTRIGCGGRHKVKDVENSCGVGGKRRSVLGLEDE
jgi:hypothetical protein